MLEIDRPFEGLDEVWVWRLPHPADPEEPEEFHRVTRLGPREGATLAGRVEIRTRPSRTVLGVVDELHGLGPWRKTKLGKVTLQRTGERQSVWGASVRSGRTKASWKPGGHFQIADRSEVNQIATAGAPYPPNVRQLGRSLLRRVRDRDREVEARPAPSELTAFDGWLTATRADVAGEPTWRIVIDRRADAPDSVGLGVVLAAIGLQHRAG